MPLTHDQVAAVLAERVMGWRVAADRYLKPDRVWIPRWRFQPFRNIADALALLDAAEPEEYSISGNQGLISARVRIAGKWGEMSGLSRPATVAAAVANALGIEVPDGTSLPHQPKNDEGRNNG